MREQTTIGLVSLTRRGAQTARRINQHLQGVHYPKASFAKGEESPWEGPVKGWFQRQWPTHDAWVLVMATGIAVRLIAPVLCDKFTDPAVVLIDEQGRFPISLLSGHLGGANRLTQQIADQLGVEAVITTASDGQGIEAVDLFARRNGLIMADREEVIRATARLVNGEPITYWDPGSYLRGEVPTTPSAGRVPLIMIEHLPGTDHEHGVVCRLLPKNVVVGVGFRREITGETLFDALVAFLMRQGMDPRRVKCLASIDLKTKSVAFKRCHHVFERTFGAIDPQTISIEAIAKVEKTFETSDFVQRTIGVGAVAAPCGYLASQGGVQVGSVYRGKGMTFSCWIERAEK